MAGVKILTIPSGEQNSNAFPIAIGSARQALLILFLAPAVLPETINIQVAGPLANFVILRSGLQVITLAAGMGDQIVAACPEQLRLRATAPVADDRVFEVLWNVRPGV